MNKPAAPGSAQEYGSARASAVMVRSGQARAVFDHLVGRWRDLVNASFDVLLYDLTSTYFEADPPFPDEDKRRFG